MRERISGFTIGKSSGLNIEIVTVNYIPRVLAVWNGSKFIYRVGK